MQQSDTVLITGSSGLIGRALKRKLIAMNQSLLMPTHAELDLRNQTAVFHYFEKKKPAYVFHLAAVVGGIHANNTYPGKFIYDNTQMHCNIIEASRLYQIKKLLFPGSACTYPKLAIQPIKESSFLDGFIEPTNIAYAAAKINGIVMCQSYAREYGLSVVLPMPTNAYGIGDNFDPSASHVIPALMKRLHEATESNIAEITLWGSGKPLREFIYADDLANAFIFLMKHYDSYDIINIGTMQEISIIELAKKIATVVGYEGKIFTDIQKPDGVKRKCLDSSKLFSLGWEPVVSLDMGLKKMYHHHFTEEVLTP